MTTSAHFSELSVSHVLVPGGRCFPPRNLAHAGRSRLGESGRGGLPRGLSLESQPQYQVWGVCVCVRAPGIIAALQISSARAGVSVPGAEVGLRPREPDACRPATLTPGLAGARTPSSPGARGGLGSRRWTVAAPSMRDPRGGGEAAQGHGGRTRAHATACRGPAVGHRSGMFLGLSLAEGWLWGRPRRGHSAVLFRASTSPGDCGEDERTPAVPALSDDCGPSPHPGLRQSQARGSRGRGGRQARGLLGRRGHLQLVYVGKRFRHPNNSLTKEFQEHN